MSADIALRKQLIAAGVTTPLHATTAPQGATQPYIVYRAETIQDHDLKGRSGLAFTDITYIIHAVSVAAARTIATAIETALDGLNGTVQTVKFGVVFHQTTTDGIDESDSSPVVLVLVRAIWYP